MHPAREHRLGTPTPPPRLLALRTPARVARARLWEGVWARQAEVGERARVGTGRPCARSLRVPEPPASASAPGCLAPQVAAREAVSMPRAAQQATQGKARRESSGAAGSGSTPLPAEAGAPEQEDGSAAPVCSAALAAPRPAQAGHAATDACD